MHRLFVCLFLVFLLIPSWGQISGVILDENHSTLPRANIMLLPDSLMTVTNLSGSFQFTNLSDGPYRLVSSFVGYKTDTVLIEVVNGQAAELEIHLNPSNVILDEVVISEEHTKQDETLHTDHVHEDFFQKNLQGAFAKSIEKLPGISAINVGVGIAKPVIRGLSANRIIVNHLGIKQESQQWSSDHGLEIDQFDVDRVEIIKGPGSLQYGSDGLGGVINIMPTKIIPKNTLAGSAVGVYKTNNQHWGGSAQLSANLDNWFASARYSRQDFADYQVPGTVFNYNGFDLPIVNERLKNTAGDESNLSLTAGVNRSWEITRLHYSQYSLRAGLFSGAVGIPRSYALTDDGNDRDLDVPRQEVDHYRLSLNQTFFFGPDHLTFDMGFQRNHRGEFSEPEFHSIPLSQLEDPNDKLAIELKLQTLSLAVHYEHRFLPDWKNIYGGNVQHQRHTRGGFEFLLPDFQTLRGGIFTITEKEIQEAWIINGGLRMDLGQNKTEYFRQYIWNSNEIITDSLLSPQTDDLFFNWSASIGSGLKLQGGEWLLKANIGKSFRVPYPAETVSNGIHHGTFRHEVGTPDLDSEQGYQLDLSADWNFEKFKGSLACYFNYFDNYIYLGPTFPAQFSPLPEAGQIFRYRQDDAIYTGFELQWNWNFIPGFFIDQSIDFVQSFNPRTKLALPFTPQPSIRTDLRYELTETNWMKDFYFEIAHQFHFAAEGQWRIDRSETETPSYQLWGLGVGTELKISGQQIQLSCQVQNVFDTSYFAHLSRYRLINVPEQGRNVVFTIKVPFVAKL